MPPPSSSITTPPPDPLGIGIDKRHLGTVDVALMVFAMIVVTVLCGDRGTHEQGVLFLLVVFTGLAPVVLVGITSVCIAKLVTLQGSMSSTGASYDALTATTIGVFLSAAYIYVAAIGSAISTGIVGAILAVLGRPQYIITGLFAVLLTVWFEASPLGFARFVDVLWEDAVVPLWYGAIGVVNLALYIVNLLIPVWNSFIWAFSPPFRAFVGELFKLTDRCLLEAGLTMAKAFGSFLGQLVSVVIEWMFNDPASKMPELLPVFHELSVALLQTKSILGCSCESLSFALYLVPVPFGRLGINTFLDGTAGFFSKPLRVAGKMAFDVSLGSQWATPAVVSLAANATGVPLAVLHVLAKVSKGQVPNLSPIFDNAVGVIVYAASAMDQSIQGSIDVLGHLVASPGSNNNIGVNNTVIDYRTNEWPPIFELFALWGTRWIRLTEWVVNVGLSVDKYGDIDTYNTRKLFSEAVQIVNVTRACLAAVLKDSMSPFIGGEELSCMIYPPGYARDACMKAPEDFKTGGLADVVGDVGIALLNTAQWVYDLVLQSIFGFVRIGEDGGDNTKRVYSWGALVQSLNRDYVARVYVSWELAAVQFGSALGYSRGSNTRTDGVGCVAQEGLQLANVLLNNTMTVFYTLATITDGHDAKDLAKNVDKLLLPIAAQAYRVAACAPAIAETIHQAFGLRANTCMAGQAHHAATGGVKSQMEALLMPRTMTLYPLASRQGMCTASTSPCLKIAAYDTVVEYEKLCGKVEEVQFSESMSGYPSVLTAAQPPTVAWNTTARCAALAGVLQEKYDVGCFRTAYSPELMLCDVGYLVENVLRTLTDTAYAALHLAFKAVEKAIDPKSLLVLTWPRAETNMLMCDLQRIIANVVAVVLSSMTQEVNLMVAVIASSTASGATATEMDVITAEVETLIADVVYSVAMIGLLPVNITLGTLEGFVDAFGNDTAIGKSKFDSVNTGRASTGKKVLSGIGAGFGTVADSADNLVVSVVVNYIDAYLSIGVGICESIARLFEATSTIPTTVNDCTTARQQAGFVQPAYSQAELAELSSSCISQLVSEYKGVIACDYPTAEHVVYCMLQDPSGSAANTGGADPVAIAYSVSGGCSTWGPGYSDKAIVSAMVGWAQGYLFPPLPSAPVANNGPLLPPGVGMACFMIGNANLLNQVRVILVDIVVFAGEAVQTVISFIGMLIGGPQFVHPFVTGVEALWTNFKSMGTAIAHALESILTHIPGVGQMVRFYRSTLCPLVYTLYNDVVVPINNAVHDVCGKTICKSIKHMDALSLSSCRNPLPFVAARAEIIPQSCFKTSTCTSTLGGGGVTCLNTDGSTVLCNLCPATQSPTCNTDSFTCVCGPPQSTRTTCMPPSTSACTTTSSTAVCSVVPQFGAPSIGVMRCSQCTGPNAFLGCNGVCECALSNTTYSPATASFGTSCRTLPVGASCDPNSEEYALALAPGQGLPPLNQLNGTRLGPNDVTLIPFTQCDLNLGGRCADTTGLYYDRTCVCSPLPSLYRRRLLSEPEPAITSVYTCEGGCDRPDAMCTFLPGNVPAPCSVCPRDNLHCSEGEGGCVCATPEVYLGELERAMLPQYHTEEGWMIVAQPTWLGNSLCSELARAHGLQHPNSTYNETMARVPLLDGLMLRECLRLRGWALGLGKLTGVPLPRDALHNPFLAIEFAGVAFHSIVRAIQAGDGAEAMRVMVQQTIDAGGDVALTIQSYVAWKRTVEEWEIASPKIQGAVKQALLPWGERASNFGGNLVGFVTSSIGHVRTAAAVPVHVDALRRLYAAHEPSKRKAKQPPPPPPAPPAIRRRSKSRSKSMSMGESASSHGRALLSAASWVAREVQSCALIDMFWKVGMTLRRVFRGYYGDIFKAQTKSFVEFNATAAYVAKYDTRTATWKEWFEIDTLERYWKQLRDGDVDGIEVANAAVSFLTCDFETITLCSVNRGLFRSAKLVFVLMAVGVWLLQYATLKVVNLKFLAVFIYPAVVMLVAYDYSPMCLPMVPTCLTSDIMDIMLFFKPTRGQLYVSHLSHVWAANNLTLDRCSDAPFNFWALPSNFAYMSEEDPDDGETKRSLLTRDWLPLYTPEQGKNATFRACNAVTFGRNAGHVLFAIAAMAVGFQLVWNLIQALMSMGLELLDGVGVFGRMQTAQSSVNATPPMVAALDEQRSQREHEHDD